MKKISTTVSIFAAVAISHLHHANYGVKASKHLSPSAVLQPFSVYQCFAIIAAKIIIRILSR